ncbi:ubiquinol-cytochrome C chaperone family protein [Brevundimonas sp.]|uniref:ubiquinol-cytochrome C chaperone family protein n=1 Tax=Brevundimonas sp. TaxID=1871086 RepID=UPI00391B649F
MFKTRPSRQAAEQLYAACAAQARRPVFYTHMGVPDRIDARFELYTLHVLLVLLRLREEGQKGADTAQDLFDTYVSALDNTLRELGVGDVAVGKKMRRLGEAMYGRMSAYEKAILAGDEDTLATALGRNILEADEATPEMRAMAAYAMRTRASLADQPFENVLAAPAWAEPMQAAA